MFNSYYLWNLQSDLNKTFVKELKILSNRISDLEKENLELKEIISFYLKYKDWISKLYDFLHDYEKEKCWE